MFQEKESRYYEGLKLFFLSLAFFFIIGSYTIARELKDAIFAFIVGKYYINAAKVMTMVGLVPAIFLYSKLVDRMRRYYLLAAYSAFYAITGLIFAYFIGHPTIGIANTDTSPYRFLGWALYFFVEGYSPFVVSVFWAFANSISSPETAKKYGIMVSGSKLGGMAASLFAWYFLNLTALDGLPRYTDTFNHQVLLLVSSLMLLFVPFIIMALMKLVPGRYLHGYEAVYRLEKEKQKHGKSDTGIFAGLKMLIKYPYVLGIFGMVFFYETVTTVLSVMRIGIAQTSSTTMSGASAYLFKIIFVTHAIGFFIALIGTGTLIKKLGEKWCLFLIPLSSGMLLSYFMVSYTGFFEWLNPASALVVAYIGLKSINYAFSWPVRESLYIPTVKEIKFKSKSWIDAFGSKFAKSSGSAFNAYAELIPTSLFLTAHSVFFGILIGLWMLAAYLLGRRFEQAVNNDEVIGIDN